MYYQNESDETLVMLTLAGEQNAYEILVTRYQNTVISSAITITKNRFMAEDAAQDAFVTAWMKLNTLQEPQKYASWVRRIAKNCALNMINRYRSFLPLDIVDNLNINDSGAENPAERYALSEERSEVKKTVEMLPQKVRQIIHLHYFEDLSIAEIADRMRISEGTVKRQLHDGRKRIRKELCAMNEKYNDTLVQRVMKKVEELKIWQIKNDKSGFEKVYKEVLREVEELPECQEKQHALADVLMRGWWWIPGGKNDALFKRIADAAMEGKNEEVMSFIVSREDSKVYYDEGINFIKEKQIPRLEKAGFVKTLGMEWFWLGYELFRNGKKEEAHEAYNKVNEILEKEDSYRILVPYALKIEEESEGRYKNTLKDHYIIGATAEEYRTFNGKLCRFSHKDISRGCVRAVNRNGHRIFSNASECDGYFFADISIGETFFGSDGTALSFISDNETVNTPAGKFEGCKLWQIKRWTDEGKTTFRTFYKDGIGIVRQENTTDGVTETYSLIRYEIKGGKGLLPLFTGNTWEYTDNYSPDIISSEISITVSYADENRVVITNWYNTERKDYDTDSWIDTVQQIANEYVHYDKDGKWHICDIYSIIDRAEKLAITPMQKAHTRLAASVARRILDTDQKINPDRTATGHWNFFGRNYIRKKNDGLYLTTYNTRWSFEAKDFNGMGYAEDPILFNDILGILQDATNCLWADEWQIDTAPTVEYSLYDTPIKTQITCENGGTVKTKAGNFENCLKISLDICGMEEGWSYRNGKKVYYFAEGIGIIRTENEYCGGAKTAVYELTSYEGTAEGFMPLADGLVRRYDALDLTDGFVGAVEYIYAEDEDGDIVVFSDQTGIREIPPPITQYCAIQGETIEQQLWDEGKWEEGHMKYAANNFHLLQHIISRPSRNRNDAKRSIELHDFYMKLMELFGKDGEVPPAWYSLYALSAIIRSAALFGDGRKEDGYNSLDIAVKYCEKIAQLKSGDQLDTGNEVLLGGIKYEYGKGFIVTPDGSKEPVAYEHQMNFRARTLVYCLTASSGWEWFNSVRDEDRFKEYIEQAREIADKE